MKIKLPTVKLPTIRRRRKDPDVDIEFMSLDEMRDECTKSIGASEERIASIKLHFWLIGASVVALLVDIWVPGYVLTGFGWGLNLATMAQGMAVNQRCNRSSRRIARIRRVAKL